MLEFYKSYSTLNEVDPVQNSASCNVTSNSIFVSWKITPRWEFDSNVIDKFVVSWFPYDNEEARFLFKFSEVYKLVIFSNFMGERTIEPEKRNKLIVGWICCRLVGLLKLEWRFLNMKIL